MNVATFFPVPAASEGVGEALTAWVAAGVAVVLTPPQPPRIGFATSSTANTAYRVDFLDINILSSFA
jgi:hypothetical protein